LKGKGGKWKYVSPISPFILRPADFASSYCLPISTTHFPKKNIPNGLIFRRLLLLIRIRTNARININLITSSRGKYRKKSLPKTPGCAIYITTFQHSPLRCKLTSQSNQPTNIVHHNRYMSEQEMLDLASKFSPYRCVSRPPISAFLWHMESSKTDATAYASQVAVHVVYVANRRCRY
jgi:hypothetical protein